ncbi:MAG: DUF748 domain-containing protein [Deltaproteobacteria bacterium]|nr:DUF748 domain-containing protein [Deltaproteobacteria bacterium]
MAWIGGTRSWPSLRKGLLAIAAAVGIFALFGFFALPAILKPVVRDALSEALHRKTSIRKVRVNPFVLSVAVQGLEISERNDPGKWISVEEVFVNLQLASVYRMGPVLKEIRLTKPRVSIVRRKDGTYNFTDIIEERMNKQSDNTAPLKYSFNNIQLIDGQVDFLDGPKGARHKVEGIQLAVPFFSNLKYAVDRYVAPSFSAVVNGDAVSMKGWTKPFKESLETIFEINIADLDLPRYLEYLPFRREYEVPSALLDVKAIIRFLERKGLPPSISVDGYALLRDVRVTGRDKSPMISLPSVRAVVLPVDIGAGEYRLASLTVKDPEIDVVIDRNKRLNLLSLIPEKEKEKEIVKEKQDTKKESVFSIDSVRLSGGKVRFTDASRPDVFKTVLGDIRIDVDALSTEKGKAAAASLALSTEAGESVGLMGNLSLAPVGSEGTLTVDMLALGKYAPYYREKVLFDVMRGALDLRTEYSFAQTPEGDRFRLHGLAVSVDGLRLRQREEKEDFLDIPAFSVKDARIDPGLKEIEVGEIATGKGRIAIRKGADGKMNVSRLVPEGAGAGDSAKAAPESAEKAAGKPAEGKPWLVTVKKTVVDQYAVRYLDGTTNPRIELDFNGMRLRAENVTTEKKRKGTFSFATGYEREGTLSLAGSFSVDPLSMVAKLRAKGLRFGRLQPYWTDYVKVLVTDGKISAEGTVRIAAPKGGPLQAGYKGEASVNGFSSLDKEQGEEFLKFETLHFAGIDAGYMPTSVAIREIALSDFYSRIIINADGTLNVQGIVAKGGGQDNAAEKAAPEDGAGKAGPEASSGPSAAAGPPAPVRIDNVTLQGGEVDFSDRYIKPNYSANLTEIGGRVSGLSSDESRLADIDLRGKLGKTTPLEIKGKINPLAKDLFLDIDVDFRDVELSPLTPYFGRYAGYEIEKGKLTLNLSYRIEKKKLDAKNTVFIDQFTFGNPVESPDATKLPVKLAVSLLKDRSGEIHLDLPVTGRTDDPKFSVWRIVWKIIGNLLVKAATSPFALIGGLLGGGGEELAYVEFDPGRSDIPAVGMAKVRNLEKALYDRPALKLEIVGHADLERDPEALRQVVFRRKVAAQKVKALVKAGQPAPAVDNVRVDPAEYPKYLALAYKEEKFPKPRNIIGMAKELPVPEMEKLMTTHIRVTESDLRQLAVNRATRVRDALVADGKVEPGRVFLVEPKSLAPAKKEKLKDSRVDFLIK